MVETSFNIFDVIVLTIVGLSALFSFYRGFVRELLSLGAWVGALIITLYAFPHAKELLNDKIDNKLVIDLTASIGVYLTALILLSILTSMMMKFLKTGKEVGALDNLLGLMFGVLRGLFIVSLGFLGVTKAFEEDKYPPYIKEAYTLPYVKKVTGMFVSIAPEYLGESKTKADANGEKSNNYQWESMDKLQEMINEKSEGSAE